jgi:hypothetical protein
MSMMALLRYLADTGEPEFLSVGSFFARYVDHTDDCQKGITSDVCTCGLMKNLPRILSLALDAETRANIAVSEAIKDERAK